MRSLIYRGQGQMEVGEWPEPEVGPGEVLIQVAACGICGTDLHVYKGMPANWAVPGVQGHEISGRVIGWAEDVSGFSEGDPVVVQPLRWCGTCAACRAGRTNLCSHMCLIGGEQQGGFAERVAVPAASVRRLSTSIDLQHAATIEPLATVVHAIARYQPGNPQRVAVFGAGPLGLFAVQLAHLSGAEVVVGVDVVNERVDLACRLGATHGVNGIENDAVDAILDLTDGEGVDLVIEAAGAAITRQQAIRSCRAGGTVVFVALGADPVPIDFMSVVPREISLQGAQCHTHVDFYEAIRLLSTGQVTVTDMITPLPLESGAEAFESLTSAPGELIKVVLEPS